MSKFNRILIEERVKDHPETLHICNFFPKVEKISIRKVEDIFNRVKKPYLQKRDSLQLFIGRKEGELIKLAPRAYGTEGAPHYYFVHAYNCIYECEYCYLQGYFHSPDLVLFVNHDEIISAMQTIVNETDGDIWFHAGEFSDSLALSHLTNEIPHYFEFFKKNPRAKLELRTKSVNIKVLANLAPLENVFVSFSLAPEKQVTQMEHKTAPLHLRIQAIAHLQNLGYKIGIHFDPIIYVENYLEEYDVLLKTLLSQAREKNINYISCGMVRFSKESFIEVKRNYPNSALLGQEFNAGFDGKIRYFRPLRLEVLNQIKKLCLNHGVDKNKIYLCMES